MRPIARVEPAGVIPYIAVMARFVFILLLAFGMPPFAVAECVVLLHGLARTSNSLKPMELALRTQGYHVVNTQYPSTSGTVEDLAESVLPPAISRCGEEKVSFVTHSLGGILLRDYLASNTVRKIGRTVMLGPPNHGSEIVDTFGTYRLFAWLNGPAGAELGSRPGNLPEQLGPARFEVGIIAGELSISPLFSYIIKGRDDGKVSVSSTRLDGMKDHIVIPTTHTFMMMNPYVIAQTVTFLAEGRFNPDLSLGQFLRKELP